MIWTKQAYLFDVNLWLKGDDPTNPPPEGRGEIRNGHWKHLNSMRVLTVCDKWEYPWFAAWDLAFQCVPFALVDPDFAKNQLWCLLFEQFQHPNGQIPAFEWDFSDLNPPVHAWAVWRVYNMDRVRSGKADRVWLERCFHKLLINFAWWINKVDREGNNVFEGGFLGLDNIAVVDRSRKDQHGTMIEQSDATGWMGMFCLNLMRIALELATENRTYEALATKFFQHYTYIAAAMKQQGSRAIRSGTRPTASSTTSSATRTGTRAAQGPVAGGLDPAVRRRAARRGLDQAVRGVPRPLPLVPEEPPRVDQGGRPHRRARRPDDARLDDPQPGADPADDPADHGPGRVPLRLRRPEPVQGPQGPPFVLDGQTVTYEPAEAATKIKGGNSNWRGPLWYPTSFLLIESLRKLGKAFESGTPAGEQLNLPFDDMAREIATRMIATFTRGPDGRRPVFGTAAKFQDDPHWRDHLLFYEYFHGDTGAGLGASHQTGWTALIANLIDEWPLR